MPEQTDPDIFFMKLALREGRKGVGRTSPNPAVGAVVVLDGAVVGRGYHKKAGTPHAEVHALRDAGGLAKGATIYVTLEPCNHTGRTPPCTRAILAAGIRRVVVGMIDPNPLVAGSGCAFLRRHGIEVRENVLADHCRALNYPFIKYIVNKRPWVIIKAGSSMDGRIAAADGKPGWITGAESRRAVHRLRDRVDAILVGSQTALNDDPSLTTRLERRRGRDPLRVVLDTHLRMAPLARMLNQASSAATWIFCGLNSDEAARRALEKAGARVVPVAADGRGGVDLSKVLDELGRSRITSLLVEGGGRTHASFLRDGLVDQVILFLAPVFLGGDAVPVVGTLGLPDVGAGKRFVPSRIKRLGEDVMIEGLVRAVD